MLPLNAQQVERLQALQMSRDHDRLAALIATAFPEVPGRLGERYPSLVAHAVQRSESHGLRHAACVARYLACCCAMGADFETRPGNEWAAGVLADASRSEGAKVFQLCRRTRESLGSAPGGIAPAAFDQALALLDAALADRGPMGSLQRGPRIVLGQACDIDAIDLRLAEGAPRQRYAIENNQWRRVPWPAPAKAVTVGAVSGALPSLPERLSLLSPAAGAQPTRLRVRCAAAHCCDPVLHPRVLLNDPQAPREWRGTLAADVMLEPFADALPEPPPGAPAPLIAAAGSPRLAQLVVGACGLREQGTPLGEQSTQIAVHRIDQHLMVWRREPGPVMAWPSAAPVDAAARTACRIERDGHLLDASAWTAGFAQLDAQLASGLDRLYTAWGRESGLERTTMQAEPALLTGEAGVSWGWSEGREGLADAAYFRVLGRLELLACRLSLRLGGELVLDDSVSRLSLQCHAQERLQVSWESGVEGGPLPTLAPAHLAFRLPFVLQVDSVAAASVAMLDSSPASGAITGQCGLRMRADGAGLQWFAQMAVEPVHAHFRVHDPLRGVMGHPRRLLPALPLVDWSLG